MMKKLRSRALMYRDWGRVGNNSEETGDRFCYQIDGIEYDFKFLYEVPGYNFKSTEMNAAFGLIQLEKLPKFQEIRRKNFQRFLNNLSDIENLILPSEREKFDWLALPLMSSHRSELLRYLEANQVQTRVCFAGNITRHPAYRQYLQEFSEADRVMKEGFLIGIHQGLTLEDVDYVCDLLKKFKPSSTSTSSTST